MSRWLIGTALFATIFFSLNQICHHATDGYFPYEIPASVCNHPEWDVAPKEVIHLLNQPYYYLGKGHQCFVFESEDRTTILKFPFHSKMIPPIWLRPIPFISDIYYSRKRQKKARKLQQDTESYLLAYRQLQEDTGVHYIHFNRTEKTLPQVKLYDKIGVVHTLCLNHMEFILQHKADHLFETIDRWMHAGQIELAKRGLLDLIDLFKRRFDLQIEDREYVLNGNYGFLNDRAMMMDIGRLRTLKEPLSKETQATLIWGVFTPLSAHLEQHYPELALFLEEERKSYAFR